MGCQFALPDEAVEGSKRIDDRADPRGRAAPPSQLIDQLLYFAWGDQVDRTTKHLPWQLVERFEVVDGTGPVGTTPLIEHEAFASTSDEALSYLLQRHRLAGTGRSGGCALQPDLQVARTKQPQLA